ncbi:cytochrome-b5 reductase [Malassezia sp. CBS 17886]|nr:cytochrome-b5 reductase [Malassezia sp. CBS 17886]
MWRNLGAREERDAPCARGAEAAPAGIPTIVWGAADDPPPFPAHESAQRQAPPRASGPAGSPAPPTRAPVATLAPPPSTLRPPARTSGLGALRAPSAGTTRLDAPVARKKVALAPGCSPLDWARLTSTEDLRGGVTSLLRVTPSELKRHSTRDDAWTAIQGRVYNISPYLRFHPGGEDTLLRIAGRDGTRLVLLTHSWVNIEAVVGSATVGILVEGGGRE